MKVLCELAMERGMELERERDIDSQADVDLAVEINDFLDEIG